MAKYDAIQTFFVPADRVNGSPFCFLTGIDLYFKAKPNEIRTISGITKPGVTVHLCPVEANHTPKPEVVITDSLKRLSYDDIPVLKYEVVQKDIIDTEALQSYSYSPIYTETLFQAIMPKDHLITLPSYNFDFAAIDHTVILYVNAKGIEGKGYNYNVTNSTKGQFIKASTATYPGLQNLSADEKTKYAKSLKCDSADQTPNWSYGRATNEIKGLAKFVWQHSKNNNRRYTINLGSGKGVSSTCLLRYASAIKTDAILSNSIQVPGITSDSTVYGDSAKVQFNSPVIVKTDTLYGIVIDYEDSDYQLWLNTQGEQLIGTIGQSGTHISPGATGKGDGKYFEYTNDQLRAQNNKDLMFEVFAAKFTANTADVELAHKDYEFMTIDDYPLTGNTFYPGEFVYEDYGNQLANATHGFTGSGFFTNGTVSISNDKAIDPEHPDNYKIVGTGTTFTQTFAIGDNIVITDLTNANTIVREISYISDNLNMVVTEPVSFKNTAAFVKKTALAKVYDVDYSTNTAILIDSLANSSIFFNNDGIKYVTITAGGSGYNNTDILRVYGGGATINATAGVTTNASGGVVALRFSNVGTGFISTPSFILSNSTVLTSNTSLGSGATFTANINGGVIKAITSFCSANIVSIDDYPISVFDPEIFVDTQSVDTALSIQHNFAYKSGSNYYVNSAMLNTTSEHKNYVTDYSALLMSRSKEVTNPTNIYKNDKSSVLKVNLKANRPVDKGLYVSPILHSDAMNVFTYGYDINNDVSNEITRYGSATTKYVSKKITFSSNRVAEDVRVYMTAYRPRDTDIKVYAKIYNTADGDIFERKSWTPLEVLDGINSYSSSTDFSDVVEIVLGFPKYPSISSTLSDGTTTVTSACTTLTAAGTTFLTDLATKDVIRVYDPNNANTNYFIASVSTVTDDLNVVINSSTTNASVLGTGFSIDKITTANKNCAFNNPQNSNIVRYYNLDTSQIDGYNVIAIKIVLLSPSNNLVPEVEDIRVIGVSA